MDNNMISQGVDIVGKAIAADGEGEYEKALGLYRDALQRFTIGLKYEKNSSRKHLILEQVPRYIARAVELVEYVSKQNELDSLLANDGNHPYNPKHKDQHSALTTVVSEKVSVGTPSILKSRNSSSFRFTLGCVTAGLVGVGLGFFLAS